MPWLWIIPLVSYGTRAAVACRAGRWWGMCALHPLRGWRVAMVRVYSLPPSRNPSAQPQYHNQQSWPRCWITRYMPFNIVHKLSVSACWVRNR